MSKKPAVVAKTAPKKRGRPAGSKAKPKLQPVDWEKLCKRLQEALASEMREADALRDELNRKRNFFERLVCLTTGTV
jgi:hypothetical protein